MQDPYLEITFRHGKPVAAYFYLPRSQGQSVARTELMDHGLVVDFDAAGTAIGVEITSPSAVTLDAFNSLLAKLGHSPVTHDDLAPLRAA